MPVIIPDLQTALQSSSNALETKPQVISPVVDPEVPQPDLNIFEPLLYQQGTGLSYQGSGTVISSTNGIKIYDEGNLVLSKAIALNFIGDAVEVTANGSTAYITISGTGGSSYGNSNVSNFLAHYGSNTISTTGNVTVNGLFANTLQNLNGLTINNGDSSHGQTSGLTVVSNGDGNATSLFNTYGDIVLASSDTGTSLNYFTFDKLGNVYFPNKLSVTGSILSPLFRINDSGNTNWQLYGNTLTATTGAKWISNTNTNDDYILSNIGGFIHFQSLFANANIASELHLEHGQAHIVVNDGTSQEWIFDSNGTLTVPGDITSSSDTTITAEDDVSILGGNKVPGSDSGEGGDININGGNGRIDNGTSTGSGGDVTIQGGIGGDGVSSSAGTGGGVTLQAGLGGDANAGNAVQAGEGGRILIQGGDGGDNAGNNALSGIGGNVEIYGGSGSFDNANTIPNGAPGHVNLYGGNWGFNFAPTGNIYLNTYDGTNFKTLAYDYNGNVTMAAGGGINFVGSNPGIVQSLNQDLKFTVSDDEEDGWAIRSIVNDGAGNDLTKTEVMYDEFRITTDMQGASHNWNFYDNGLMAVPGNIMGTYGGDTSLYAFDNGSGGMVEMKTISYIGDTLLANVTVRHPNVTISTQNSAYTWTFGGTGNLTLPLSGNLVGATANNNGYLNWFGNSSGDGGGYTTLRLVPDDTREASDQYLIIDPTAPGHIHIRAGGTQDNSNADLFLGGENSYFKVNAGANNEVRISANSHPWVFGADSILTVPGEGVIRSIQDTVVLQSYDINGNTYSARLGTTGGLYFETSDYPTGWLNLTNNAGNANISSPGGSINIDSADGTSGAAGKDINITAGDADQTDYYTTAGGDVNIQGGMGAFNDGGGGGPGGNINLVAGTSADPAGHAGNVTITSGTWNWQFYNNGNLYVPGQINGDNNGNLIIDGAGYGNGYVSLPAGSFGGEQVSIVNDFSLGNGIALTTNGGTWHFDNTGNLSAPGNISGNTAGYTIGYRDIPQVTFSANATAALTDAGKHYYSTTAGNLALTLPDNSNVALPTGATLTVVVNASGNVLVNQGTGVTLYQAGSSTTGNRVVGAYGLASVMKVAANTWVISGTGVY